jgi:PH domain
MLSEAPPSHPPLAEEALAVRPDGNVLQQIGDPDLDGWLRKKGVRYNTWKLRYFVLKGPHLYYLRSKTVRASASSIPCTDDTSILYRRASSKATLTSRDIG